MQGPIVGFASDRGMWCPEEGEGEEEEEETKMKKKSTRISVCRN
jgi:hypothetical protein